MQTSETSDAGIWQKISILGINLVFHFLFYFLSLVFFYSKFFCVCVSRITLKVPRQKNTDNTKNTEKKQIRISKRRKMCHLLCPSHFTLHDGECVCFNRSNPVHFHSFPSFPTQCNTLVYKAVHFEEATPKLMSFGMKTNEWKNVVDFPLFKSIHESSFGYKIRVRVRNDRPYYMIRDATGRSFGSANMTIFSTLTSNESIDVFVQTFPFRLSFY